MKFNFFLFHGLDSNDCFFIQALIWIESKTVSLSLFYFIIISIVKVEETFLYYTKTKRAIDASEKRVSEQEPYK